MEEATATSLNRFPLAGRPGEKNSFPSLGMIFKLSPAEGLNVGPNSVG